MLTWLEQFLVRYPELALIPGDRRGLLDRKLQDRRLQSRPGHGCTEQSLGITRVKPGLASAWRKFELRAYQLDADSAIAGLTVAVAEARIPEHRLTWGSVMVVVFAS